MRRVVRRSILHLARVDPVRGLGYGSLALGILLVVSAALSEAAMAATRALGAESLVYPEELSGFVAFEIEHHVAFALGQVGFGVVTGLVGIGVLRRRRWARAALEGLSWFSILLNFATAPLLISSYRGAPEPMRTLVMGGTVVVTVVLTAATLVLIRYLRSAPVRLAFGQPR